MALRLVQMDLPVVDGWTRPDSVTRLVETTKWMETPWEAAQKDLTRVVLTPEGILSLIPFARVQPFVRPWGTLRLRLKDRCSSTDFAEEPKETGTTVHSLWMLKSCCDR